MKFGVIYHQNNLNIGDDIQAYATARFLPQIDYFIDREHIDAFRPDAEEPVAVIMNAWYMWNKWNWPPSPYIVPKMVGFHYADHQLAKQPGTSVKYEFLTGFGGDYLRAYGPVGCRDYFTMERLQEIGIDAYFSGCVTMTLEKQPSRPDKGSYVCLVDLEPAVERKVRALIEPTGLEVRVMTHNRERDEELPWEERVAIVKDYLTTYQNARCVVTKRLHCALPCLALETPLLLIKGMANDIRFSPYYDFLYWVKTSDFLSEDYVLDYDFLNPPANKSDYKPYREKLITDCEAFVREVEASDGSVSSYIKTTYTEADLIPWRHDLMKKALDDIYQGYRAEQLKSKLQGTTLKQQEKRIMQLEEELASMRSWKPVRFAYFLNSVLAPIRALFRKNE